MIKLQTSVETSSSDIRIGYGDNFISVGSCFADNIGRYMKECRFNIMVNPSGIAYNPCSVMKSLQDVILRKKLDQEDIIENQGLYYSLMHHGDFYALTPEKLKETIDSNTEKAYQFSRNLTVLMVTFGTARVYEYIPTGKVAANCHKLPQKLFRNKLLDTDRIAEEWTLFIKGMQETWPGLKVIFTVSPIRHWKDGAHGNQLSKSTLLLAIDKIISSVDRCDYFPAYEIMMDELRDYRFYEEDMLHPSRLAVEHIRECFFRRYMDEGEIRLLQRIGNLNRAKQHRPIHPESDEWLKFQNKIKKEEADLDNLLAELRGL